MSNIVINDLEINLDLDQQALSALTGGGYGKKKFCFSKKKIFVFKKVYKKHGCHQKAYYFKPVKLFFIEPYFVPYKKHHGYGSYC